MSGVAAPQTPYFSGPIENAIAACRRQRKNLVVFLKGEDLASQAADRSIQAALAAGSPGCIALRLHDDLSNGNARPQSGAKSFRQIFPSISTLPFLMVLDPEGNEVARVQGEAVIQHAASAMGASCNPQAQQHEGNEEPIAGATQNSKGGRPNQRPMTSLEDADLETASSLSSGVSTTEAGLKDIPHPMQRAESPMVETPTSTAESGFGSTPFPPEDTFLATGKDWPVEKGSSGKPQSRIADIGSSLMAASQQAAQVAAFHQRNAAWTESVKARAQQATTQPGTNFSRPQLPEMEGSNLSSPDWRNYFSTKELPSQPSPTSTSRTSSRDGHCSPSHRSSPSLAQPVQPSWPGSGSPSAFRSPQTGPAGSGEELRKNGDADSLGWTQGFQDNHEEANQLRPNLPGNAGPGADVTVDSSYGPTEQSIIAEQTKSVSPASSVAEEVYPQHNVKPGQQNLQAEDYSSPADMASPHSNKEEQVLQDVDAEVPARQASPFGSPSSQPRQGDQTEAIQGLKAAIQHNVHALQDSSAAPALDPYDMQSNSGLATGGLDRKIVSFGSLAEALPEHEPAAPHTFAAQVSGREPDAARIHTGPTSLGQAHQSEYAMSQAPHNELLSHPPEDATDPGTDTTLMRGAESLTGDTSHVVGQSDNELARSLSQNDDSPQSGLGVPGDSIEKGALEGSQKQLPHHELPGSALQQNHPEPLDLTLIHNGLHGHSSFMPEAVPPVDDHPALHHPTEEDEYRRASLLVSSPGASDDSPASTAEQRGDRHPSMLRPQEQASIPADDLDYDQPAKTHAEPILQGAQASPADKAREEASDAAFEEALKYNKKFGPSKGSGALEAQQVAGAAAATAAERAKQDTAGAAESGQQAPESQGYAQNVSRKPAPSDPAGGVEERSLNKGGSDLLQKNQRSSEMLIKPGTSDTNKSGLSTADITQLSFRLTNGSTIRKRFRAQSTLRSVRTYLDSHRTDGHGPYLLRTPFPYRVLDSSHYSMTLKELDLHPSSVLTLQPTEQSKVLSLGTQGVQACADYIRWYFTALAALFLGFFSGIFGSGQEEAAQQTQLQTPPPRRSALKEAAPSHGWKEATSFKGGAVHGGSSPRGKMQESASPSAASATTFQGGTVFEGSTPRSKATSPNADKIAADSRPTHLPDNGEKGG